MTDSSSLTPVSMDPSAHWWLVAYLTWAGPGRWLPGFALPMRGLVAAGGDPVMRHELPAGARILESDDMVLPGLHDAHVHTGLIDLKAVRAGGIAAVTDLGGVPQRLATLSRDSRDPASGLPVVEFAGAFLTAPGGYPSDRSWAAPGSWREVHSVADAETAVAEQFAHGAVVIKVAINVSAGPVLEPAVLTAVVSAAHAVGLQVVAHAEGEGAVRMALSAGVDALAHTPWTEELGADLARECARQTLWISSMNIHGRRRSMALQNLIDFVDHGGQVRYGTDLGNGQQRLGVSSEEILALHRVGFRVDDVLAAMTGPMFGRPTTSSTAAVPSSRFVEGVTPCLLMNDIEPDTPVVGPQLRQARLLSVEDIQEMERWLR
jgi:imidazolonepropionase-like amidohydrolase